VFGLIPVFLADGFEEVEAVAALDVIRRAKIEIYSVGIGSEIVTGSHNMKFICDKTDAEIDLSSELSGIILPGGMPGTLNLENNMTVQKAIDFAAEKGIKQHSCIFICRSVVFWEVFTTCFFYYLYYNVKRKIGLVYLP
jgi:hypothetical protein